MFRVLVAGVLDAEAERKLAAAAQIVRPPGLAEPQLASAVADCDAMVARTEVAVTRAVLAAGRRLRVVGVAGVGVDRVDTSAAAELGIRVLHVPAASSDAVAEFTVALMLQLLRPIPRLAEAYRSGRFHEARRAAHGDELRELTIGIVGMGRIGSRVGRICRAGIGATVLYNDVVDVGPLGYEATSVEKRDLWAAADVITLHVPLTDATRRLIDASVLSRVRPSALLVNTARGAVVDTDALTAALRERRLAAAALDVTDPEPLPPEHPLFSLEHCLLTPHVAARTRGGLRRMFEVVDDVLRCLRGEAAP